MKKVLSFLLVVCILQGILVMLPITSSAASSGMCGENVQWTLSNNQVLTISGHGKMDNYSNCYPWANVKKLIIEDGVTYVGKEIFLKAKNLTTVEIGDDVTLIGEAAFRECHNLTSVKLGKGLTEIGEDAFFMCDNLKSIELPDGLLKIGRTSFMASGLESIKIPESVTVIDTSAFQTCESLTSVVVPDSVKELGHGAFGYCESLKTAKIGDGVTSFDESTFSDCTSLTSIELGKGLSFVWAYAFDGTDNLKDIYYNGTESEWNNVSIYEGNDALKNATVHYMKNEDGTSVISVLVDGTRVNFDVAPKIIDGRTMVPIRAIFEAMKASVSWDADTSSAICKKGGTTVTMTVDSVDMKINGKVKKMDTAPLIIDGRTLAPARFVAEAFGATVGWDDKTQTVTITSK